MIVNKAKVLLKLRLLALPWIAILISGTLGSVKSVVLHTQVQCMSSGLQRNPIVIVLSRKRSQFQDSLVVKVESNKFQKKPLFPKFLLVNSKILSTNLGSLPYNGCIIIALYI